VAFRIFPVWNGGRQPGRWTSRARIRAGASSVPVLGYPLIWVKNLVRNASTDRGPYRSGWNLPGVSGTQIWL